MTQSTQVPSLLSLPCAFTWSPSPFYLPFLGPRGPLQSRTSAFPPQDIVGGLFKNGLCCCSKDFPKQSYGLFNALGGGGGLPFPVEDQRFLSIKQELVPEYSEIPARPGPVL